jgi:voltage-gated potassium channel
VEEIQVPMHAATNNWGVLKHRGEHYVLLAVRDEKDWSFNPSDDYILQSGQTIIAMASPEGRLELQKALGSQV